MTELPKLGKLYNGYVMVVHARSNHCRPDS